MRKLHASRTNRERICNMTIILGAERFAERLKYNCFCIVYYFDNTHRNPALPFPALSSSPSRSSPQWTARNRAGQRARHVVVVESAVSYRITMFLQNSNELRSLRSSISFDGIYI